jgi:hypothetical protein
MNRALQNACARRALRVCCTATASPRVPRVAAARYIQRTDIAIGANGCVYYSGCFSHTVALPYNAMRTTLFTPTSPRYCTRCSRSRRSLGSRLGHWHAWWTTGLRVDGCDHPLSSLPCSGGCMRGAVLQQPTPPPIRTVVLQRDDHYPRAASMGCEVGLEEALRILRPAEVAVRAGEARLRAALAVWIRRRRAALRPGEEVKMHKVERTRVRNVPRPAAHRRRVKRFCVHHQSPACQRCPPPASLVPVVQPRR